MTESFNTPILFLTFNRPETTLKVFKQIKKVQPKYLFIASDGPRTNVKGEKELVFIVREMLKKIDWECNVKRLYRDSNLGCKLSVSSAIDWFFENVDKGIILEDDCLPDITFFRFAEQLLNKYENDHRVFQINGTNFLLKEKSIIESYYFSRYSLIWGWATWKRAWLKYDIDMHDFELFENKNSIKSILSNKTEQKHALNNFRKRYFDNRETWDTQWAYTIMKNNGVTITPYKNLVINIGAYHEKATRFFLKDKIRTQVITEEMHFPLIHPAFLIDTNNDNETFNKVWSRGYKRIIRLTKENGFFNIIIYILNKYIKKKWK